MSPDQPLIGGSAFRPTSAALSAWKCRSSDVLSVAKRIKQPSNSMMRFARIKLGLSTSYVCSSECAYTCPCRIILVAEATRSGIFGQAKADVIVIVGGGFSGLHGRGAPPAAGAAAAARGAGGARGRRRPRRGLPRPTGKSTCSTCAPRPCPPSPARPTTSSTGSTASTARSTRWAPASSCRGASTAATWNPSWPRPRRAPCKACPWKSAMTRP